ncbi:DNA polymerase III DnaE [uncultured Caudovirales phage]|uniref:DNA-directed DNA polymerase n=1 Tax=uncultured Caudovirales phage TaxID=2100421 RepID=A0A6J5RT56_9CAUD|nr:DNA polymerase III DnaE [uncultured Caudovirales phage]
MAQVAEISEPYFPVHAHSEFSALDGIGSVKDMVVTVEDNGQPGLALTDHGNMAGCLRLYKECKKIGIVPFPGEEFYLVIDNVAPAVKGAKDSRDRRYHLGILALNERGFRALVNLSTRSHQRERFHRKPLIDTEDLSELGANYGNDVAITTGCYFGLLVQHTIAGGTVNHNDMTLRARIVLTQLKAMRFKHIFVELQNHDIDHSEGDHPFTDVELSRVLHEAALAEGLPVVIGQDSHYCDSGDKAAHDTMKEIAYLGGSGEDYKFPGDCFHLATNEWVREHWRSDAWSDAMQGHQHLLDLNTLSLPELDTYKFHVPSTGKDPQGDLARAVYAANQFDGDEYRARIDEELSVIEAKGMAGYFLLVADYMLWCRDEGIFVNARGSANGSLVCYLLGITNVDPVKWGTGFSRFLSLDRAKPPDIDVDIESNRRDDVINYIRTRYPSLIQMGTWLRLGASSEEEDKGSVFVQYHAAMRSRGTYDKNIPASELAKLRLLGNMDVRKSPGAHASGFVLPGDGLSISDYLPAMLIPSSGAMVVQCPMDDVEDAGYVKLDLLGLRSLTTMRKVMELIGKDPVTDGMEWIPDDDVAACKLLRSGVADNGVFQFEGFSTAKGARKMGVRSTDDAILALALFRPAMLGSGMTDRYLAARKAKSRELIHPTVDDLFDRTWGVPVFQEDVLALMERAGLDVSDRNDVLKAVKASNDKIVEYALSIFERIGKKFVGRATSTLGCSADDARKMWKTIMDFSDYGFNRAHATAYGLMGYRMAYLKAHHPVEFHAALLSTWAGTDKESKYVSEARRLGIQIRKPDVNASAVSWTIDPADDVLVKGLITIKGIGMSAATAIVDEREKDGVYASMESFCKRSGRAVTGVKPFLATGDWKGVALTLRDADALRSLGIRA